MNDHPRSDESRTGEPRPSVARTRAEVRRGWWPGWIWAVPIAAVLLVGWWAIRSMINGGQTITISFDNVHGMKANDTDVMYHGMKVGTVSAMTLAKDGKSIQVTVHINSDASNLLRTGTRFWLRGAKPSLSDPASLAAVLSGPTLMMDPGPGKTASHFVGLPYQPVVPQAHEPPQDYAMMLPGSVGGLSPGDPVKLRGFTVGDIKTVGFRYDAQSGRIETPVTIELYPSLFHLTGTANNEDGTLKSAVADLIKKGLRAELQRDPPVIGSPEVTLATEPGATEPGATVPGEAGAGASPAALDGLPQIPAASGGGLQSIVERVNKVPVDQIANNVLDVTHQVDAIVSSSDLKDAIAQLDGTLAQIHQTADRAGPQVTALVDRLRQTSEQLNTAVRDVESVAKSAQRTAATANNLLGATPSQNDAQTAMREITEAARSVRELADYLDRHPEALVQGRKGGQ